MTDTCCRERIESGLKKDQEADFGFQKGVITFQKTGLGSQLLLYIKKYHIEVIAFPLLRDLLFKMLYSEPAQ